MIKAIVYKSNTGFTKEYAQLLSKEVGIPAYDLKEAKKEVANNEEIMYMGWVMAGAINSFKKAVKRYSIKGICAVGMSLPTEEQNTDIIQKNNLNKDEFFYLQGGFDMEKLTGIYKFMMKSMQATIQKDLEKKENKTEQDLQTLEMMKGRVNYVSIENLKEVIEFAKANK